MSIHLFVMKAGLLTRPFHFGRDLPGDLCQWFWVGYPKRPFLVRKETELTAAGTVPDSHRIPFWSLASNLIQRTFTRQR